MASRTFAPKEIPAGNLLRLSTEGQTDRQLLAQFVERRDAVAFEALVHATGPWC